MSFSNYKPRNINVLFSECDHNSMAMHLTRNNFEGFKKCCLSNAADETDYNMLWNGNEEDGNVRSVRKMKALPVKMDTVTLIFKGRWNLSCFVY
jgi:hypothetical protein